MGQEIERKYLLKGDKWRSLCVGQEYSQGYISTVGENTVRVRIIGEQGYLTLKGKTTGRTRSEFEYPIPVEDAREMLNTLCLHPVIEKTRYKIQQGDLTWEIDEFRGENKGLIIAEVELKTEEQQIDLPDWIDREVTEQKYFNSSLVKYPYSQWQEK